MPASPVMNTQAPAYYYASSPKSIREYPDRYLYTYEEPASTGKKVGVGVASYFMPGLGQAINGQWGKALGFFAASIGTAIVSGVATVIPMLLKPNAARNAIKSTLSAVIGVAALIGIDIWSIVDAVKNAKTNKEIVVMKDRRAI